MYYSTHLQRSESAQAFPVFFLFLHRQQLLLLLPQLSLQGKVFLLLPDILIKVQILPLGYVLSEARSCRSAFSLFPAANSLLHNFSDFHLTEIFLHRQAVKELFSSPDLTPLQELLRFLQDTSYDNLSEDTIFHPVHLP